MTISLQTHTKTPLKLKFSDLEFVLLCIEHPNNLFLPKPCISDKLFQNYSKTLISYEMCIANRENVIDNKTCNLSLIENQNGLTCKYCLNFYATFVTGYGSQKFGVDFIKQYTPYT
jgi:hypothetical protein